MKEQLYLFNQTIHEMRMKIHQTLKLSSIFLCLLCFGCNTNKSSTVQQSIDSSSSNSSSDIFLPNYIYLLKLFKGGKKEGKATGFFLREKGHLFLVSSYHVFTNQNTAYKIKESVIDDSIQLVYSKSLFLKDTLNINIITISKESKSYFFYEYPDIYVYDVTSRIPLREYILSVESFIYPSFKAQPSKDIVSYGYGDVLNDNIYELHFDTSAAPFDSIAFMYADSSNYVVMRNSYFLKGDAYEGMSGAPVFFKYGPNDSIVFGGVISTTLPTVDQTVIVKPSELLKKIDEQLSK
jgi:hypothetical protein